MPHFKPKDIIAGITLVGIFFLKARGLNGDFDTVAALILGYYFVKRENGLDKGI